MHGLLPGPGMSPNRKLSNYHKMGLLPLFRPSGQKAGDSLLSPQFAVKQDAQLRKRLTQFARFQQVGWIPRAAGKFKLRAGESLHQQNTIGAKSPRHLWKERSL